MTGSLDMTESSYRCFTRCFSSCLGSKDSQNETTINGELYHNGFTPIEDRTTMQQGDGFNGSKKQAKTVNGKGCCALPRTGDESDYAYDQLPVCGEDMDRRVPSLKNDLYITHKETNNSSTYVTSVQPLSLMKNILDKTQTQTSVMQSGVNGNLTLDSTPNNLLRDSLKQKQDNMNRNQSGSVLHTNEHDTTSNNISPKSMSLNLNGENLKPVDVTETRNTFSQNMNHVPHLNSDTHAFNNNQNRKDVIESKRVPHGEEVSHTHNLDSKNALISSVTDTTMKLDTNINMKETLIGSEVKCDQKTVQKQQDKVIKDTNGGIEEEHDIPYFRNMIKTEQSKLNDLISLWEKVLTEHTDLHEEVQDEIHSVVGQTRLVISERFAQFGSLVDQSENYHSLCEDEKNKVEVMTVVTLSDLQGFWDMIYFQVEDVLTKFDRLDKAKNHKWDFETLRNEKKKTQKRSKPVTTRKVRTHTKTNSSRPKVVSEEEKARKLAAKKRLMEARRKMAAQNRTNKNDDMTITIAMQ